MIFDELTYLSKCEYSTVGTTDYGIRHICRYTPKPEGMLVAASECSNGVNSGSYWNFRTAIEGTKDSDCGDVTYMALRE